MPAKWPQFPGAQLRPAIGPKATANGMDVGHLLLCRPTRNAPANTSHLLLTNAFFSASARCCCCGCRWSPLLFGKLLLLWLKAEAKCNVREFLLILLLHLMFLQFPSPISATNKLFFCLLQTLYYCGNRSENDGGGNSMRLISVQKGENNPSSNV